MKGSMKKLSVSFLLSFMFKIYFFAQSCFSWTKKHKEYVFFVVYKSVFGVTSKKGQHFNSGEMKGEEGGEMGNKKNCQQHKMAVVIRLSLGL